MSGPLQIFRRHQKALLAVFGVLIMITFTIGGVITSYQNQHRGLSGTSETVLTWKHGTLTERELQFERDSHNLTVRFLDALIARTIEKGGTPKGPGLSRDQQGRVIEPGIPRSFADRDLVRTMLLAQKAKDVGMKVSDEAIFQFLDTLSDDEVPRSEYGDILSTATGGQFFKLQLFDRLRTELLAQNMRMLSGTGVFAMSPFSMSPGLAWDYFNRLNRRVKIEALPLPVSDFKDKVAGQPTDAQIKQLYEDGKNRYFDPYSSEPGFKQRRKIAFEYLKADFEDFLAKEMAAITDEQIKEYYEENKSDFKAVELPSTDEEMSESGGDETESEETEPAPETPTEETPENPAPMPEESDAAEAVEAEPPAEEASEAPAEDTSEPAAEPEEAPNADEDAAESKAPADEETKPAVDLQAPANEKPEADPAETTPAEDAEAPSETDQSRAEMIPGLAVPTFVSLTAQEEEAAEAAEPGATDNEDVPEDATEPPADSQPEPTADTTTAPAEEAEETDAVPVETADDSATSEAAPETSEDEQAVTYKPLEEVADEIRRNLARAPAQEAMNEALKGARSKIESYFKELAKWNALSREDETLPKPAAPDTQAIAAEFGLVAGDTPLVDALEVADYEIGKAYRFDFSQGQMGRISFAEIAFTSGLPLYKTDQIRSFEVDVEFLYWKVEETEPEVPELKEIRDEVVDFWTTREAIALAKSQADALAEKAAEDKPLSESAGEDLAADVIESNEFSWLTRGAMPGGFGTPTLSSVDGVDSPGDEFMKSVFDLQVGQTGVAVNAPETVVYVVRVISEAPSEDQRRQQFLTNSMSYETAYIAMAERQRFLNQWYDDLEEEMQVTWLRQPDEQQGF